MSNAKHIAAKLKRQHQARARFESIIVGAADADIALAYDAQTHFIDDLIVRGEGGVAGWKVGLTSARMQEMCGVNQPIGGAVLANRIHKSGVSVEASKYVRLGVESELAVRLSQDLPAGVQIDELPSYLDAVSVAFELVDDRGADYAKLSAASIVADNSWNEGLVLGEPRPLPRDGLTGLPGELFRNGERIDEGNSGAVLGDPLRVLQWLAGHLASRGQVLFAGQWVSTGSIVTTKFVTAGENYRFEVARLGAVDVRIA